MINVAIWPYSTGEVILQNYNVLLTLKSLLTNSDGIIPLYNDDVLSACRHLLKVPRPSYKIMNTVIAQSLLTILFPAANSPTSDHLALWDSSSVGNSLSNLTQTLCTSPAHRLLTLLTLPTCDHHVSSFNADLWDALVQRVKQMLLTRSSEHKVNWQIHPGDKRAVRSLADLLVMRGDKVYEE